MGLRLRICSLCFFLSLTTICSQASENPVLNQRQNQILQNVVTGELNNSVHREFWSYFSKTQIREARNSQDLLHSELPTLLRWQKAVWTSVRESYLASRKVRTDEYVKLKKSLATGAFKNLKQLKDAVANAEMMLDLAANRKDLQVANGLIELNDANAETILVNLEAAFKRLEKLFDPDWRYEIDQASPEAYASIIEKQNSWEGKAAACYRFWRVISGAMEIAFREANMSGDKSETHKVGESFLNIKWRELFIDKIVKQKQLEDVRDKAFALGAGVDLMDKSAPKPIKQVCGSDINRYLKLAPDISEEALAEAQQYINGIQ